MDRMLENSRSLGAKEIDLEVIKNNEPAHQLFLKKGFVETDTYLVMRHAPHAAVDPIPGQIWWMDAPSALDKLETYPNHITWINAPESMRNSPNTEGLHLQLPNADSGWLVYRNTRFTLRSTLSHLVMHTEKGDPQLIGAQLLSNLHEHFPLHDTYAENISENDPHLPAFYDMGYFTNFSRIEMRLTL